MNNLDRIQLLTMVVLSLPTSGLHLLAVFITCSLSSLTSWLHHLLALFITYILSSSPTSCFHLQPVFIHVIYFTMFTYFQVVYFMSRGQGIHTYSESYRVYQDQLETRDQPDAMELTDRRCVASCPGKSTTSPETSVALSLHYQARI